ncbi:hypothetical protein [Halomonas sp. WWR20]
MSEMKRVKPLLAAMTLVLGSLALSGCGDDETPEQVEQNQGASSPSEDRNEVLATDSEREVILSDEDTIGGEDDSIDSQEALSARSGEDPQVTGSADDRQRSRPEQDEDPVEPEPSEQDSFDDTTAGGTAGGSLVDEDPDEER